MLRMSARVALAIMAGLVGAACGASAPARFYTLDAKAVADDAPPATYGIVIAQVSVPAVVDRPQFVVQVAPNRVEIDEFNRWAAPLDETIADAVVSDLSAILRTTSVATALRASFDAAYRVTIHVQRFDSIPGDAVLVEAVWSVTRTANGETHTGRTTSREVAGDDSYDALAAAHGRALTKLSRDIAGQIRASAATAP